MSRVKVLFFSLILSLAFITYAGKTGEDSTLKQKVDSTASTIQKKANKNFAKIKGARELPENKTNWSKIKDLFL